MANVLSLRHSNPISGPSTQTHTVITAGPFYASCLTFDCPPAGTTIDIQQNGTTVLPNGPVTVTSVNQPNLFADARMSCVTNDVISIIVTSSNPLDALTNQLKSIMIVRPGL